MFLASLAHHQGVYNCLKQSKVHSNHQAAPITVHNSIYYKSYTDKTYDYFTT